MAFVNTSTAARSFVEQIGGFEEFIVGHRRTMAGRTHKVVMPWMGAGLRACSTGR